MRAAASSIASGMLVQPAAQLGERLARLEAATRTQNSSTASVSASGSTGYSTSPPIAQQLSTRDHGPQPRAGLEQLSKLGRGIRDLLEVVQHEQKLAIGDVLCEAGLRAQGLGERLGDERRIAYGRQIRPEHSGREGGHEVRGDLERQPCLARTTRPGERDEARPVLQHLPQFDALLRPADQRRGGPGQVRIGDRPQRWEVVVAELKQSDRLVEVLQPVLPQLRQLVVDERLRRRETTIWPPWPADMIRAARCRSMPT